MTQITYDTRQTDTEALSMPRGDTRKHTFTHVLGAAAAVKEARFMIRTDDTNETVLVSLSKDSNPTQFDFSTSNECTITLAASDTTGVALGSHKYALELVDQSDLVYTPWTGEFTLTDDVVNDDETAPHLSWNTRATLDAQIDALETKVSGMITSVNASYLASSASASATQITVNNGAVFSALDTIRVILDSGTYDDNTASTVSSSVITLGTPLAGAASANNIVRKV